jgi:hypothetical protein
MRKRDLSRDQLLDMLVGGGEGGDFSGGFSRKMLNRVHNTASGGVGLRLTYDARAMKGYVVSIARRGQG